MPKLILLLSFVLCIPMCFAQESTQDPAQDEPIITIPSTEDLQARPAGGRAFTTDLSEAFRNRWGFMLSAYEGYTTDVAASTDVKGSGISAFVPRTFFNLGGRRSRLHMDLSAGYRLYNRQRHLDSWDYYGTATYTYQISRRTVFQVTDQLTSSFNDSWSFVSLNSPLTYKPTFSNEVMFNLQRITRNSLNADISTQIGRKALLGVFAAYNLYQYDQNSLEDTHAVQVGARLDLKLTRWLNLMNSYSTYVNHVDERLLDTRVHRLQVGGLDFRLARSWRLWATGGAELADELSGNQVRESISAGTELEGEKANLSFTYQRGFTSGIGISQLLMSDIYSANFGYRLTSWLNTNLESYYYRSNQIEGSGLLETLSAGGGFQFAIVTNLIASLNGNYQSQRSRDFTVQGLGLHRFNAYVGLQYVWPSLSRARIAPANRQKGTMPRGPAGSY